MPSITQHLWYWQCDLPWWMARRRLLVDTVLVMEPRVSSTCEVEASAVIDNTKICYDVHAEHHAASVAWQCDLRWWIARCRLRVDQAMVMEPRVSSTSEWKPPPNEICYDVHAEHLAA